MTDSPLPKGSLLADLESRQDELLRQLAELEERTRAVLAELGVAAEVPAAGKTPTAAPTRRVA